MPSPTSMTNDLFPNRRGTNMETTWTTWTTCSLEHRTKNTSDCTQDKSRVYAEVLARSALWGIRTDSLVRPIWMMKDTPGGGGCCAGISATPPGPWTGISSIRGNPPGAGAEGTEEMGVPCCITAEPGGEEPPGGKNTWAMAPEDMQGLALAIQSPGAVGVKRGESPPKTHQPVEERRGKKTKN
ncbi:hypothetical protein EYF80_044119 [Liparis tanakae]|uniref:Uncharacterized protein n=1 Tax=Liparis tanakae TaxID=230148 RepID=A0A4Z2FXT5_9TELE|nr:hypothetical protein EYF80_044119 [Liparis tanakae]